MILMWIMGLRIRFGLQLRELVGRKHFQSEPKA